MSTTSRASVASIARYWADAPELCDISPSPGAEHSVADLRFCLERCADLLEAPPPETPTSGPDCDRPRLIPTHEEAAELARRDVDDAFAATPPPRIGSGVEERLRAALEWLIAEHVRKINRVVAAGLHEGDAIREAADAVLEALSAPPALVGGRG